MITFQEYCHVNNIEYEKKLLDVNRFSNPDKPLYDIRGLCFHYTENPNISANGVQWWFNTAPDRFEKTGKKWFGSTQFVAGKSGEIVQMLEDDRMAYGAGASHYRPGIRKKLGYPNRHLLQIELCHDADGSFSPETLESACMWAGFYMAKHDLKIHNLHRHFDITGKNCPSWFVRNPSQWNQFRLDCEGCFVIG